MAAGESDSHSRALKLSKGWKSFARWAKYPNGRALVFVNGFGGAPKKTWPEFPNLLVERRECDGADLIFYGYHSFRARVAASADEFSSFLEKLCTWPSVITNGSLRPELHRKENFQYQSVIIVAHSLGAVVVRKALLEFEEEFKAKEWLTKIRLILFAPAHMGADVVPFGAEFLQSSFRLAAVQFASNLLIPVWRDLPPDCKTIKGLASRTEKALDHLKQEGGPTNHLVAERVIFGTLENIVNQDPFCSDPKPKRLPERTHFSVCKPTRKALDPLEQLIECL